MPSKRVKALRKALIECLDWSEEGTVYQAHPKAPVFENQLLVSDEHGKQFVISINAIRIPRIALTK